MAPVESHRASDEHGKRIRRGMETNLSPLYPIGIDFFHGIHTGIHSTFGDQHLQFPGRHDGPVLMISRTQDGIIESVQARRPGRAAACACTDTVFKVPIHPLTRTPRCPAAAAARDRLSNLITSES
jgi:hypothetical protein